MDFLANMNDSDGAPVQPGRTQAPFFDHYVYDQETSNHEIDAGAASE